MSTGTHLQRSITRRLAIAAGAAGLAGIGAAVAAERLPASLPSINSSEANTPVSTATIAAEPATPAGEPLAPEYASVRQLRRALDSGRLSSQELVESSLARIARLDGGDLGLHAVIELNLEAAEIARMRDEELAAGLHRGPLHGIPVLVKDVFATADGMATTAGSLALTDNAVVADATVIRHLREAGAIVLGKSNLTEWCNFRGSLQTSGWSARGGQTRNPYQLDMSPWGSSSGSAVAVAAGYVPLGLGVETDGSIVSPASAASVVGFKPTVGLTSRSGVLSISYTQDSPGPFGRTVEDVAYLMSAIAGRDEADHGQGELGWTSPAATYATSPVHEHGAVDYTAGLDPNGLRGARIGIARNLFYDAEASLLVEQVLPVFTAAGAILIDGANIPTHADLASGTIEFGTLITEFVHVLSTYLSEFSPSGPIWTLEDIIAFNESHAAEELLYTDQSNLYAALDVGTIADAWYLENVANGLLLARDQGLDAVLDGYNLDALIAPTTAPPTAISPGGDNFPGASSQISAMAGYPTISVPVGYVRGLPVGISFMGRAFSDAKLLNLAYAFEQAHPVRQAPEFRAGSLA